MRSCCRPCSRHRTPILMASSLDQPFLAKPSSSPVRRTTLGVLILPVAASLLFLAAFAAFCAAIPNININNPFAICAHAPSPTTYSCVALVSREILIDSGINLPLTQTQRLQLLLLKSLPAVATSTEKARRRSLAPGVVSIRRQRMGLSDCVQLLNLSRDQLVDSLVVLIRSPELSKRAHSDVHTWLSAVLTNYVTCLDGLRGEAKSAMEARVEHLMDLATASLAMVVSLSPPGLPDAEDVLRQPLVKYHYPSWVTSADRNLLESSATEMKPHAVVSKDGKGDSTTVQGAIDAAPSRSKTRYVIRVKAGTYKEVVRINQDKENIMLVGEGMKSTIITGDLNYVDGNSTFDSATLASVGKGFIAQNLCIQNTAGPEKHQAVALRVGGDKSVIDRCKMDGYQDTLYVHQNRQFYRNCSISGTVDFIFGDAAVVFQACDIIARKPMDNQKNMVTAQGRVRETQNTGITIQMCNVIPSEDLAPHVDKIESYLGRPWKNYSRTVFMQSKIESHINPLGWYPWNEDKGLDTLYYGEFRNFGPGSKTGKRVKWPGYHVITDTDVAMDFTVKEVIQGGDWLPSTGVPFEEGLGRP